MLRKEWLLNKSKSLGTGGRAYNWVMDFLFDREKQVRVGAEYSSVYASLLLFIIMTMTSSLKV